MKEAGLLSQEDPQFFHAEMTKNIGQKLYQSLFIGKIQQALFQELGKTAGEKLHIQIQYDANVIESSLLSLYPWQLVHNGNEFLADFQVSFSYLIAHTNPPPQGKRKVKQIRILLIPSTASDEQYKSIESKESVINQGLTKASQEGRACLLSWYQTTEKPTIGRLRTYLTEQSEPLDILHFDGHGFFKRKCSNPVCPNRDTNQIFYSLGTQNCKSCGSVLEEPQGFLFFDRDESGIEYVSAADFARVVGQSKPMLVVITACKAALAYKSDSVFNGVAQKLLRQVPAVVATPFSLSEESATNFVEQFYRALGAKKSLLEAVKLAADAMCHHKDEWYRPMIFLRSDSDEDGNLFEFSEQQTTTRLEKVIYLRDKFLMCQSIKNQSKRKQIILNLSSEIANNIEQDGDPNTVVLNLIQTCLEYPDGLHNLLKTTEMLFENGSIQMKNLWQSAKELFPEEVSK